MNQNPFSADQRLIEPLLKRSREVSVSSGEGQILFSQGDAPIGLYLVERGAAALIMKSATGRVATCFHSGPGSVLGLPAVVADQPYSLTAMADRGAGIRFVTRSDYEEVMRADPGLYLYVLQILAAEVRSARVATMEWKGQSGRDQCRALVVRTPVASQP